MSKTNTNTRPNENEETNAAKDLEKFHKRLMLNDMEAVKKFLSDEKMLEEFTSMGEETTCGLSLSIWTGDTEMLELLLEKGVGAQKIMDSLVDHSERDLNYTLSKENSRPLEILLENGASSQTLIDALATYGSNLWIAFHEQNIGLIRLILESGANADDLIKAASTGKYEGVNTSFMRGNLEIPKLLLEFGADPKLLMAPSKEGDWVVRHMLNNTDILSEDKLRFLKQVLDEGVDVSHISKDLDLLDPCIVELLREYKIKNAKKFIGAEGDVTFGSLKEEVMKRSWTASREGEVMEYDLQYRYEMSVYRLEANQDEDVKERLLRLPNAVNYDNFENRGIEDYKYRNSETCLELVFDLYQLDKVPYAYSLNCTHVNPLDIEGFLKERIGHEEGEKYGVWRDLDLWREGDSYSLSESSTFYGWIIEPYLRNTLDFEFMAELLKIMDEISGNRLDIPKGFTMVSPFKLDIMKGYEVEFKSTFWSLFCEIVSRKDWGEFKDVSIRSIV